ncbi:hypothetical protein LIA77_11814 [Sarocladium implicatum]|nr:hypothetical protein LIA77_11814 [Sarocladium implicatum]
MEHEASQRSRNHAWLSWSLEGSKGSLSGMQIFACPGLRERWTRLGIFPPLDLCRQVLAIIYIRGWVLEMRRSGDETQQSKSREGSVSRKVPQKADPDVRTPDAPLVRTDWAWDEDLLVRPRGPGGCTITQLHFGKEGLGVDPAEPLPLLCAATVAPSSGCHGTEGRLNRNRLQPQWPKTFLLRRLCPLHSIKRLSPANIRCRNARTSMQLASLSCIIPSHQRCLYWSDCKTALAMHHVGQTRQTSSISHWELGPGRSLDIIKNGWE